MLKVMDVHLIPGDLDKNYLAVLEALHLSTPDPDEEEMKDVEERLLPKQVSRFTIQVADDELVFEVGKGKYKTAALVLYLVEKHDLNPLRLGPRDIEFIRTYYPPYLIEEVRRDPKTKHTALRALLFEGPATVKVQKS
jgi:hypothetical protein